VEYWGFLRVQIAERIAELCSPVENLSLFQQPSASNGLVEYLSQVATSHKIHHKIFTVIFGKVIRNFRQIGVVKTRQNTGLTMELLLRLEKHLLVRAQVWLDFFYRTETPFEADIFCPIHSTHPALPDRGENAVTLAQ
jgi:hypothetical protein